MLTVTKSVSVVACLILGSFSCIIDQVVTSSATCEPGKPLTLLYYFDFIHWAQYNMPYHCNGTFHSRRFRSGVDRTDMNVDVLPRELYYIFTISRVYPKAAVFVLDWIKH